MSGSRYTMQVQVTGNAEQALGAIASQLQRVGNLMEQTNQRRSSAQAQQAARVAETTAVHQALALIRAGEAARQAGEAITRWSVASAKAAAAVTTNVFNEAAAFETLESKIKFAFGEDKFAQTMGKIEEEAVKLQFTLADTADFAAVLGRMKVDPFSQTYKSSLKAINNGLSEQISSFEIIQDVAMLEGRRAEDAIRAVVNFMGGNARRLAEMTNMPISALGEWRDEMKKLGSEQEQFDFLMMKLAARFGGASEAMRKNFNFLFEQLPDLAQILKKEIGKEGLEFITAALADFIDLVRDLMKDKDNIKGIKEVFTALGKAVALVINFVTRVVKVIADLSRQAPWLWPLVTVLGAIAIVMGVVTGVTLMASGAIAGLIGGLLMLKAVGLPLLPMFGAFFLVIMPIIFALGVLFVGAIAGAIGAIAAFWQFLSASTPGAKNTLGMLESLKLLFDAVVMGIKTYEDGVSRLSPELMKKLHASGLYDTWRSLMNIWHKAKTFWEGFSSRLGQMGEILSPELTATWEELVALFKALGKEFGFFDAASSKTHKWRAAGMQLADMFMTLVRGVLYLTRITARWVRFLVSSGKARAILRGLWAGFKAIIIVVGLVIIGIGVLFSAIVTGAATAVQAIEKLIAKLSGLRKIVGAVLGVASPLGAAVAPATEAFGKYHDKRRQGMALARQMDAIRQENQAIGRRSAKDALGQASGMYATISRERGGARPGVMGSVDTPFGDVAASPMTQAELAGGTPQNASPGMERLAGNMQQVVAGLHMLKGIMAKKQPITNNIHVDGKLVQSTSNDNRGGLTD